MYKLIIILILTLFALPTFASSDIEVMLTVDSIAISMEEQLEAKVRVKGTQSAGRPYFENREHFEFQSAGTSSSMQIVNGRSSVEKSYNFIISPRQMGIFTLGPAVVEVNGREYKSQPIQIKVQKAKDITVNKEKNYYIEADVDHKDVYTGQQMIYTFRLYTRLQLMNANLDMPEFKGFWKQEIGKQKTYDKIIDGISWQVVEIRYLLFPLNEGVISIPATTLSAEILVRDRRRDSPFGSFFGNSFGRRKRIRLRSKPIEVNSKLLPIQGKPDNFSGLVGQFKIGAKLDKNNVKKGESVTLTIKIAGVGNIDDAKSPQFESPNFKTYDDKPVVQTNIYKDRLVGRKIFKKALVPQKVGVNEIPKLTINYFDTSDGTYKEASSEPINMNVTPAAKGEDDLKLVDFSNKTNKRRVKLLGSDLMPIKYDVSVLQFSEMGLIAKAILILIIILSPISYFISLIYRRRLDKIQK